MRVLVLTPYLYGTAPGPRSSIELWERILKAEGIEFEYAPFETDLLHDVLYRPGHTRVKIAEMLRSYGRRIATMRRLDGFDVVLIYHEAALIGPALIERWVARTGKPIIYRLDDPIYVPYRSPVNGYLSYLKCSGKVGTVCRLSRVVIVSSDLHREYAARFSRDVRVIPVLVDGERYRSEPGARNGSGPVCVGWTGSWSTVANLRVIAGPLSSVSARDDVRLHFIGAEDVGLPGIPHTAQEYSADTAAEDLRQLDVGLLPLPVDGWTKRKFPLKLVQYMALGIPTVSTPLGSVPDVIDHGVTGFLADSPAEWRDAVERLVEDPDLRAEMGRRAAEVAHERYTLQANAGAIADAFRTATLDAA